MAKYTTIQDIKDVLCNSSATLELNNGIWNKLKKYTNYDGDINNSDGQRKYSKSILGHICMTWGSVQLNAMCK